MASTCNSSPSEREREIYKVRFVFGLENDNAHSTWVLSEIAENGVADVIMTRLLGILWLAYQLQNTKSAIVE